LATENKDFKVKNGLQIGGPTNIVNYTSASPTDPFTGQLWIDTSAEFQEFNLNDYLTIAVASATYLTQIDASLTYLSASSLVDGGGP